MNEYENNWRELAEMTDSEKLDEILSIMRATADAINSLKSNPMFAMMMG